jgi:GT2 family glycosyltransferase
VISAIVPTYRGDARLARNLPSVVAALEMCGDTWEVVVVDDGGGGLGELPAGCRLLALKENRGYGPAVNAGAAEARGDQLLILNDDARLEPGSIARLRTHFPADDLFAVVPAILSPLAACGDEGGKTGRWSSGLIEIGEVVNDTPRPTFYAVGCCFLCPRTHWQALGGYDDVYAPYFWEDVDLGYRAWRRGLRIVHVPDAVCHHEGSATIAAQRTLEERERVFFRNRVLFHLRNLRDPALRAECLGALAAFALVDPRPEHAAGLEDALALYERSPGSRDPGLTDREILDKVQRR